MKQLKYLSLRFCRGVYIINRIVFEEKQESNSGIVDFQTEDPETRIESDVKQGDIIKDPDANLLKECRLNLRRLEESNLRDASNKVITAGPIEQASAQLVGALAPSTVTPEAPAVTPAGEASLAEAHTEEEAPAPTEIGEEEGGEVKKAPLSREKVWERDANLPVKRKATLTRDFLNKLALSDENLVKIKEEILKTGTEDENLVNNVKSIQQEINILIETDDQKLNEDGILGKLTWTEIEYYKDRLKKDESVAVTTVETVKPEAEKKSESKEEFPKVVDAKELKNFDYPGDLKKPTEPTKEDWEREHVAANLQNLQVGTIVALKHDFENTVETTTGDTTTTTKLWKKKEDTPVKIVEIGTDDKKGKASIESPEGYKAWVDIEDDLRSISRSIFGEDIGETFVRERHATNLNRYAEKSEGIIKKLLDTPLTQVAEVTKLVNLETVVEGNPIVIGKDTPVYILGKAGKDRFAVRIPDTKDVGYIPSNAIDQTKIVAIEKLNPAAAIAAYKKQTETSSTNSPAVAVKTTTRPVAEFSIDA